MTTWNSHCEAVAEELRLNGFDVKAVHFSKGPHKILIEYDTIAGKMKYKCSEKSIMAEYYRFVHHLGLHLSKWGLENKINTYRDE